MLINLKKTRKQTGKSQETVANELGIPIGTYRGWEQLKSTPRGRELAALGDYFSTTVDDLFGRTERNLIHGAIQAVPIESYAPVYGSISAGIPLEANDTREDDLWVSPDVKLGHPKGFFMRVSGDSMDKLFPDGSYVFVDPDIEPKSGDIGVVIINGFDATVKRLHIAKSALTLLPESSNAEHLPQVIYVLEDDAPPVTPVGTVVWHAVRYDGKGY